MKKKVNAILKKAAYLMLVMALVVTAMPLQLNAANNEEKQNEDLEQSKADLPIKDYAENEDISNTVVEEIAFEQTYAYDGSKSGKTVTVSAKFSFDFEKETGKSTIESDEEEKTADLWTGYYAVLMTETVVLDENGNVKEGEQPSYDSIRYDYQKECSTEETISLSLTKYENVKITATVEVRNAMGVVTKKNKEDISKVGAEKDITVTMPKQIATEFVEIIGSFGTPTRKNPQTGKEDSNYYVNVASGIKVKVTADPSHTKAEQLQAMKGSLEKYLNGKQFIIREIDEMVIHDIQLPENTEFTSVLDEEEKETGVYTCEIICEDWLTISSHGKHNYTLAVAEVTGEEKKDVVTRSNDTEIADAEVAPIEQKFTYNRVEKETGNVLGEDAANPVFGETIRYRLDKATAENLYGDFSCYEVDESGAEVKDSKLQINTSVAGEVDITCNELGGHKVKFVYGVKNACEEKSQLIEFDVKKAPLKGDVYVSSKLITDENTQFEVIEDKEPIEKWKTIEVTTTLSEIKGNGLNIGEYYKGVKITYWAISQSNTDEKKWLGTFDVEKLNSKLKTISDTGEERDRVYETSLTYNPSTNTVTYVGVLDESVVEELSKTDTYEIQAVLTFDNSSPYYLSKDNAATDTLTTDGTYSVQNEDLIITDDISTDNISMEWNTSTTFSYNIKGLQSNQTVEADRVNVTINNSSEEISDIKDNDRTITIKALKAGVTTLQLNVSEKIEQGSSRNRYNDAAPRSIQITVTSPRAVYTINNMSPEDFLESVENSNGEHWCKQPVSIKLDTSTGYEKIQYRELNSEKWNSTTGAEWIIGESDLTNYEFRFVSEKNNIFSDRYIKEDGEQQGPEIIMALGVDMTAPVISEELYTTMAPTGSSDDTISYFTKNVTVMAEGIRDNSAAEVPTKGSGIKAVYVKYGNDSQWTELDISKVNCQESFNYALLLQEDKNYGTIRMKVTDCVGNESATVIYKGAYKTEKESRTGGDTPRAICVDTKTPEIQVMSYVYDNKENTYVAYDGNWVNQALKYEVSLAETSVSGVAAYEYIFVPRNKTLANTEAGWTELKIQWEGEEATADVTYGKEKKAAQQKTIAGKLKIQGEKTEVENSAENKTPKSTDETKNGTIYFRATSKAGLTTTNSDIKAASEKDNKEDKKNNKKNPNKNGAVRIWQTNIEKPNVTASAAPDKDTGWYNAGNKSVNIRFEYPEYSNQNGIKPPTGICYELKQTTIDNEGREQTKTITRTFYKGIFDDSKNEELEVTDYNDLKTKTELDKEGLICIEVDSISELTVYTVDLAGNISDKYVYTIKADFTAPENIRILFEGVKSDNNLYKSTDKNVTYSMFSKEAIKVSTEANFGISGKSKLGLMLCKDTEDMEGLSELINKSSMTIEPNNRGFVCIYAKDKAGNITKMRSDGVVADKENPVGQNSEVIDIIAYGANDNGFFNKDIPVTVKVKDAPDKDNFSGLKEITCSVGTADGETLTDMRIDDFSDKKQLKWQDIEKSASFSKENLLISAKDNESNEAYIRVTAKDNSGNVVTEEKELMIDTTMPEISVTYDKNQENSSYYNTDRVAKVEIIERNFNPESVKFIITRDGAPYNAVVDGWKTEEEVNTAYLTFHEDGDYTVTVACTDLADNEAEYTQVDEFTIDQTAPVIKVSYDNMTPWKENYYNTVRTAVITVEEHNFDEKLFQTDIVPAAEISRWSHDEDTHTATIVFAEDGQYTFNLNCTDLAGNEILPFTQEEFCIDTIAPEIRISGVADGSANAGDISPVVIMSDEHYDAEGTEIILTNSKGAQIELEIAAAGEGNTRTYTLNNVSSQPDEIYTLTAKKKDLAGNETEISCRFSLNRNGSAYDLSRMSDLVEKVYTKYLDMEDLSVLEMNVDKLEEFSIYVTRNGELLTNRKEGALPAVMEENTIYYSTKETGNDEIGYQYEYTLYRENFEQEGIYDVIFYSKDRAGNEANSTLTDKRAEITFIVDNTAPKVIIDGVESGEFYAEDSKLVNVAVTDNFKLKNASLRLVDEDGKTVETYDYMELAKEDGEIVSISLPNSSKKLSLVYSVTDMAGNENFVLEDSEEIPRAFMISTNAWLEFINNELAVAAAAGGAAVILTGIGTIAYFRKRKQAVKAGK